MRKILSSITVDQACSVSNGKPVPTSWPKFTTAAPVTVTEPWPKFTTYRPRPPVIVTSKPFPGIDGGFDGFDGFGNFFCRDSPG